jgi:hypothetical protein
MATTWRSNMANREHEERILQALVSGVFQVKLMDNQFRGLWAEYMVAEAQKQARECERKKYKGC